MKSLWIALLTLSFLVSAPASALSVSEDAIWPDHINACVQADSEPTFALYVPLIFEAYDDSWGKHTALQVRYVEDCEDADVAVFFDPVSKFCTKFGWDCGDTIYSQTYEFGTDNHKLRISKNPWLEDYADWSLEFTIWAVAKHEWGHHLGFEHENARDDTPKGCWKRPRGDKYVHDWFAVTEFDMHSIMMSRGPAENFKRSCEGPYLNGGYLSDADIAGARYVYGHMVVVQNDGTVRIPVVRADDATYEVALHYAGAGRFAVDSIEPAEEETLRPAEYDPETMTLFVPAARSEDNAHRIVDVVLKWDGEYLVPTDWEVLQ